MCGIAGIFNHKGRVSYPEIGAMLDSIRHRGPDDSGAALFNSGAALYWTDEQRGSIPPRHDFDLALGHVRLSIIDVSSAGHQPMSTPENDVWITYNGEVFNYQELRKELEGRGYVFRSNTDTEVVLYSYKEFGEACIERFRGFFAFCIYDLAGKKLFLARDRLGLKPLKYYWDGSSFIFASELKAILSLREVPRVADLQAIDRFLAFRYVLPPFTGVKNIFKLPSGCSLTLSLDDPSKGPVIRRYWLARFTPKTELPYLEARDRTMDLLEEAIRIRLFSDVPLGIFLSGGIDSSVIVALLRRHYDGEIRTFSVGFSEAKFDERRYARMVAGRYKTNHTEFLVELKPEEDLRRIVRHFDEPFADPSAVPSFYLAREAATHVKTILNGDGGDELFAGYKRYFIHRRNRAVDYLPGFVRGASRLLSGGLPPGADKSRGWGKVGRLLESISGDSVSTYALRFSALSSRARANLYKDPACVPAPNGWPAETLELLASSGASDLTERLMAIDQTTSLPEDILMKSDMAGMAHGLESRSPFLDHLFVEWANRLPMAFKAGMKGKRLLRDAMRGELPDEILDRKKAGFNPPLATWMRTFLREEAGKYLLSGESPLRLFNKAVMKEMLEIHLSGRSNLSEPLWSLLVLAVWLEINNIQMS